MDGIVAPVVGRIGLAGGNGGLLLLSIGRILRQAGGDDPRGLVFVHAGEVERRQNVHRLESALRKGAKMLHAVGILIVECVVHAAMRRGNRGVIHAEVAD